MCCRNEKPEEDLPGTDFESDVEDKVANHLDVVTGHDLRMIQFRLSVTDCKTHHLLRSVGSSFREVECSSNISSADEALGPVVGHKRGVAASLILGKNLKRKSERADGSSKSNN